MLKCIVVDDESGAVEILARYIKQTPDLDLLKTFRDPVEALSFLMKNEVDLAFLDIDMPGLDGLQLSELLGAKKTLVIFCTAYSEYAVKSYELDAVDYLLKPIAYDRFSAGVKKALALREKKGMEMPHPMKGMKSPEKMIFIKSGSKIHPTNVEDLLYMEKAGHYIVFHTKTRELLSRMTMDELLKSLPEKNFVRIHRSYVVALDKIETIEKHSVFIRDKEIPIGENFRDDFFIKISVSGK
jgi:DNA-binding LytR/AlgR family response regulator